MRIPRSVPRGAPREGPLTVFVHIPKTAGTTLAAILRDNFPGGVSSVGNSFKGRGGFDSGPVGRLREAPALRTHDMHVLTGHLPFAVRDVLPADTRYITFLRDPVERTLSQYYGLLRLNRRTPLPGDRSLAAVLAEGNIIYDNLQTRMLADNSELVGEVDENALAQARENLRSGLTAFGLVERFDESLVLFKQALDLGSVSYTQQRVTPRPRGPEVPEEEVQLAREANRFDEELYALARELFAERVAEQGLDFVVDVGAVEVARTGTTPSLPAAAAEDPATVWDLLVRTRAELFVDRRDRVRGTLAERAEMRELLISLHQSVSDLSKQVTARTPGPTAEATAGQRNRAGRGAGRAHGAVAEAAGEARPKRQKRARDSAAATGEVRPAKGRAGPKQKRGGDAVAEGGVEAQPAKQSGAGGKVKRDRLAKRAAELAGLRDEAAARLSEVDERLQTIEAAADGEGSIELERLRSEATQLGKRVEQLTSRTAQFEERVRQLDSGEPDGWETPTPMAY
jgi:hypothetical protein